MRNTYWASRCRRKRIQQILQHSVAHEPGDLIAVGAADTATQPVPNGSISPSRSPSTRYLGGSRGLDFPLRGRACTCRVSSSFASLGAARDDNWSRGARREKGRIRAWELHNRKTTRTRPRRPRRLFIRKCHISGVPRPSSANRPRPSSTNRSEEQQPSMRRRH